MRGTLSSGSCGASSCSKTVFICKSCIIYLSFPYDGKACAKRSNPHWHRDKNLAPIPGPDQGQMLVIQVLLIKTTGQSGLHQRVPLSNSPDGVPQRNGRGQPLLAPKVMAE